MSLLDSSNNFLFNPEEAIFLQEENSNVTDTGSNETNTSENDSQVVKDTFRIYGTIFVIFFILFCVLRWRYPKLYSVRSWVPAMYTELALDRHGFFRWIWELRRIDDKTMLRECGMDALCFLRVIKFGFRLSLMGMFISIWLIPIYATAEPSEETQYVVDNFQKMTTSHVPAESNRFIATVVAAYFIFLYTMHLILKEFEWYTQYRHLFLSKFSPRNYSVYVSGIPPEYQSSFALTDYFRQCFSTQGVLEAHVAMDIPDLEQKVRARDRLVEKIEHAVNLESYKGISSKSLKLESLVKHGKMESIDTISAAEERLRQLNRDIDHAINQNLATNDRFRSRMAKMHVTTKLTLSCDEDALNESHANDEDEDDSPTPRRFRLFSTGSDVGNTSPIQLARKRFGSPKRLKKSPSPEKPAHKGFRLFNTGSGESPDSTTPRKRSNSRHTSGSNSIAPPSPERYELEDGLDHAEAGYPIELETVENRLPTRGLGPPRNGSPNRSPNRSSHNGSPNRSPNRSSHNGSPNRVRVNTGVFDNEKFLPSHAEEDESVPQDAPIYDTDQPVVHGEQQWVAPVVSDSLSTSSPVPSPPPSAHSSPAPNLKAINEGDCILVDSKIMDEAPTNNDEDILVHVESEENQESTGSDEDNVGEMVARGRPSNADRRRSSVMAKAGDASKVAKLVLQEAKKELPIQEFRQYGVSRVQKMKSQGLKTFNQAKTMSIDQAKNIKAFILREGEGKPRNAGFVSFTKLSTTHAALQMIHHPTPFVMHVEEAPDPDDIYWRNVGMPHKAQQVGILTSIGLTALLCFFWTIPTSFISSLTEVESLKETMPKLDKWIEDAPWLQTLLEQIAPLLLLALNAFLPVLLTEISKFEGLIAKSTLEASVFVKLAAFMIIQTFFVSAISGGVMAELNNIIDDPNAIIDLLANSLPSQSTYFLQIILVSTFVGIPLELHRVIQLSMAFARTLIGPRLTEKERSKSFWQIRSIEDPWDFQHAEVFAQTVLYFMVFFVYSTMAPILSWFLAFCWLIMASGYRHQFIYNYAKTPDSGGKLWSGFIGIALGCMLIAQLTLVGLLALKKAPVATGLMFPLIAITILFNVYIGVQHFYVTNHLPTRECLELDRRIFERGGLDYDVLHAQYLQPALKDEARYAWPDNLDQRNSKSKLQDTGLDNIDDLL